MLTRRFGESMILLGVAAGLGVTAFGQPAASNSPVDGVTVRKSNATGQDAYRTRIAYSGGRLEARNATVAMLLDYAYGMGLYGSVAGGPDWIRTAKFDVDATASPVAQGGSRATSARSQPVLIAALEKGFNLKTRFELRPGNGLALVVGRGKLRLKATTSNSSYGSEHIRPTGFGILEGRGATMDELVSALESSTTPLLVNKTGLTGRYDFTLHWTPLATVNLDDNGAERYNLDGSISARVSDSRCVQGQEASGCNVEEGIPPLPRALESELGLKLEPMKGTLQTLVIDHIEKPAAQ